MPGGRSTASRLRLTQLQRRRIGQLQAAEIAGPAIVFTKGALRYNEFLAKPNTIVHFDPQTEKFQTWMIRPTATLCATC